MTGPSAAADRCDAGGVADPILPAAGPVAPERLVLAAGVIAELVRRVTHATAEPGGDGTVLDPAVVTALLESVYAALARLPQLARNLGAVVVGLSDDPFLRIREGGPDESGSRPGISARGMAWVANTQLQEAATSLAAAAGRIDRAWQLSSRLYTGPRSEVDPGE